MGHCSRTPRGILGVEKTQKGEAEMKTLQEIYEKKENRRLNGMRN
jgi:hypothetical protein